MLTNKRRSFSTHLQLFFIFAFTTTILALESAPFTFEHKSYKSDVENVDPEMILAILAKLGQSIINANEIESTKRGLDMGVGRAYSGSKQAKHMMGIAAAESSGGPGRRRRSQESSYRYRLPF